MPSLKEVCCPVCGATLSGTEGKTVVVCDYCGSETKQTLASAEAFTAYVADAAEIQEKSNALMKKMEDALSSGDKKLAVRYYEGQVRLQMRSAQKAVGPEALEKMITPMVHDFAKSLGVSWTPPSQQGKLGKVGALRDEQGRLVPPPLEFMSSLRCDPRGNLVVTQSGAIHKFSSGGEYSGAIEGDFKLLQDAAADAQGSVYAVDTEACLVLKFGPDGKLERSWGRKADLEDYKVQKKMDKGKKFLQPDEFAAPSYVGVDPSGSAIVADPVAGVVKKFSSGGSFVWEKRSKEIPIHLKSGKKVGLVRRLLFGGEGEKWARKETMKSISAFCIDARGSIILADNMEEKVTILDAEGRYQRSIMRVKTGLVRAEEVGECTGVAAAPGGDVFFLDTTQTPKVLGLTRKGKLKVRWGRRGAGPGEFKDPVAIAADQDGNVLVADNGNGNIQKFTPEGKFISAIGRQPKAGAPSKPEFGGTKGADLDEADEKEL
jgi:hypothetical protein